MYRSLNVFHDCFKILKITSEGSDFLSIQYTIMVANFITALDFESSSESELGGNICQIKRI